MLSTPPPRENRHEVDKKGHNWVEETQEGEHETWLIVQKLIRLKIEEVETEEEILRLEVQDEHREYYPYVLYSSEVEDVSLDVLLKPSTVILLLFPRD